ncbi:MAG: aspartate/glutamate racemase family protein [Bacillaceae bacterium]|nr:aspartate/glutamate racemase family protein [Bacillaceae bacterium]
MKIIGMIGGMSWESSIEYYRLINEFVRDRLGGLHSARSLMYSVNFEEIEQMQHRGEWDKATELMIDAARRVETGGADFLIICTNTMHRMAEDIERAIHIPLLHIADATAHRIQEKGIRRVGLLGTRFTMEEDFYRGRLQNKFGLEVLTPDTDERERVHRIIYRELCMGKIEQASRQAYLRIIDRLKSRGAEAVILGCTEISLLIKPSDCDIPLFDTTRIHAEAAVDIALK